MGHAEGDLAHSSNQKLIPVVASPAADTVTCRVRGRTARTFHTWSKEAVPQHAWEDDLLIIAARDIQVDVIIGYRFIPMISGVAESTGLPGWYSGKASGRCSPRNDYEKADPLVDEDLVNRRFTA